jgi:pyruvate dehydrogenase E2 component (dihydrolipoamide acetyltransferase)
MKDVRGRTIKEKIPYSGIRKVIGTRMRESLDTSPQGTVMARFDMSRAVALRMKMAQEGKNVTYTDILIKATCAAIKKVPIINSALLDGEIVVYETINIGVAVKVGNILVVPVVLDADKKSLLEVAADTADAIQNARAQRFDKIIMDCATFTVNNLGMYNIEGCTPLLNPPEAAILAIGRIRKDVWVGENGNIDVRDVCTMSLTIDHSVMDGGPAGEFLSALEEVIGSIETCID